MQCIVRAVHCSYEGSGFQCIVSCPLHVPQKLRCSIGFFLFCIHLHGKQIELEVIGLLSAEHPLVLPVVAVNASVIIAFLWLCSVLLARMLSVNTGEDCWVAVCWSVMIVTTWKAVPTCNKRVAASGPIINLLIFIVAHPAVAWQDVRPCYSVHNQWPLSPR